MIKVTLESIQEIRQKICYYFLTLFYYEREYTNATQFKDVTKNNLLAHLDSFGTVNPDGLFNDLQDPITDIFVHYEYDKPLNSVRYKHARNQLIRFLMAHLPHPKEVEFNDE